MYRRTCVLLCTDTVPVYLVHVHTSSLLAMRKPSRTTQHTTAASECHTVCRGWRTTVQTMVLKQMLYRGV